jgi:hypothetical protein
MRYLVSHHYPYHRATVSYEVLKVLALFPADKAESEGYDPMILLLRNLATGRKMVWPYYWTKNRLGKWANGQYPPLLSVEDLRRATEEIEKE